ncbi:MAG: DUF4111 domain-containing protein [Chloroflexota bacterium]
MRLLRDTLGDDLLGAYLHGSAVLGQLRPRSDTDVLAVTRRRITDDERATLTHGVMRLSGRRAAGGPARSVELTIVVAGEVRPWRYPPRCDLQYGEWLRAGYEAGGLATAEEHAPDLAPLLTMVLQGDRPLHGPPPATLLDPVPPADLRHAIVAGIAGLLGDLDTDTTNVLLTFARIWTTLATGAIRAKDAAADWCLARLDPDVRPPLELARDVYLGTADNDWTGRLAGARAVTAAMLSKIRALEPAAPGPSAPSAPPEEP